MDGRISFCYYWGKYIVPYEPSLTPTSPTACNSYLTLWLIITIINSDFNDT